MKKTIIKGEYLNSIVYELEPKDILNLWPGRLSFLLVEELRKKGTLIFEKVKYGFAIFTASEKIKIKEQDGFYSII